MPPWRPRKGEELWKIFSFWEKYLYGFNLVAFEKYGFSKLWYLSSELSLDSNRGAGNAVHATTSMLFYVGDINGTNVTKMLLERSRDIIRAQPHYRSNSGLGVPMIIHESWLWLQLFDCGHGEMGFEESLHFLNLQSPHVHFQGKKRLGEHDEPRER